MIIKGFQPTSLIEYPGNVSAIIFLAGCNFKCGFCYNKDLVLNSESLKEIPKEELFSILVKKRKYLDGVSITGGEPLLNEDLPEFIERIKEIGFLVKVDTNGSNPRMLEKILSQKLVDYLAMDVKTSLEKYAIATNTDVQVSKIRESASIIINSGIEYEFRTTVVPEIVEEKDVHEIGKWLAGAKKYCLQQFKPINTLSPEFCLKKPYSRETLFKFRDIAKKYFKKVEVRGI